MTDVKCPVCGRSGPVRLDDAALCLYRCSACRHAFKDIPRDRQERYQDAYFTEAHRNWFSVPDRRLFGTILRAVGREIPGRRLKLLDVGCGRGDFLRYLQASALRADLFGLDLVENSAPGIGFIRGDIMKDALPDTYDVITALAVIEHVDEPGLFVRKIADALSPDGVAFIMTDNDGGLMYRLAGILKRAGMRAAFDQLYQLHHLQCFSKTSLRSLLERSGLEVIRLSDHNYPLQAVDLPRASRAMQAVYRAAVAGIFLASGIAGGGILQTAVCRKKRG